MAEGAARLNAGTSLVSMRLRRLPPGHRIGDQPLREWTFRVAADSGVGVHPGRLLLRWRCNRGQDHTVPRGTLSFGFRLTSVMEQAAPGRERPRAGRPGIR